MPIQQRSQLKGFGQSTNEKYIVEDINDLNVNKQDTLVSGTNIKTINGNTLLGSGDLTISGGNYLSVIGKATNGTNVNGTTITKSSSILVAANTFTSGDILNIDCSFIMNSFSPTQIMSVYVYSNTSDSLTGATLLGQISPSTLKGFIGMSRTFYVSPTQKLIGIDEMTSNLNSNQSNSDYYSTITFNYTAAQYIIFACKVADTSYPTPQAHLNHAFITKP